MSTLGPYSFCLTTSGAIQYGVPTIVARLFLVSVSFAQKPKSATKQSVRGRFGLGKEVERDMVGLTDLDITTSIQENVVALDISVDNVLRVQVLQTAACLLQA